jgi:hypothetical protein
MQNQVEDLTPEQFQKKYELYNLQYLQDFSNQFFVTNVSEEWFQDRYNPINIQRVDKENSEWAAHESSNFKKNILLYPVETVNAMSLEPINSAMGRFYKTPAGAENSVISKFLLLFFFYFFFYYI